MVYPRLSFVEYEDFKISFFYLFPLSKKPKNLSVLSFALHCLSGHGMVWGKLIEATEVGLESLWCMLVSVTLQHSLFNLHIPE